MMTVDEMIIRIDKMAKLMGATFIIDEEKLKTFKKSMEIKKEN